MFNLNYRMTVCFVIPTPHIGKHPISHRHYSIKKVYKLKKSVKHALHDFTCIPPTIFNILIAMAVTRVHCRPCTWHHSGHHIHSVILIFISISLQCLFWQHRIVKLWLVWLHVDEILED